MQLVVARVAAAAAVASEATTRTALEAAKQSVDDRAMTTQSAAATATMEQDLVTRLALDEVEIEKLRAAATFANEATERTTTTTAAAEATARDAAQAAAQEKAALEAKVTDLESDLATAGVDLATANHQFSEDANLLHVVFEEATRLRENNAKLSEDLEGESDRPFFSPYLLLACFLFVLTCLSVLQGCACTALE
jgi:hypothetical protein